MKREARQKNNTKTAAAILIAIVFLSAIDGIGGGIGALLFVLVLIAVAAAAFYYAGTHLHKDKKSPLAGVEAGHLCQSHNGRRRPQESRREEEEHERYRMTSRDLRDKTEEINALYRAGIIDAEERAERLSQARDNV